MSFKFSGSISIFGFVCAEFYWLQYGVVGHKNVFLIILNLNSKFEFLGVFPGRLMIYQVYSAIKLLHSDRS